MPLVAPGLGVRLVSLVAPRSYKEGPAMRVLPFVTILLAAVACGGSGSGGTGSAAPPVASSPEVVTAFMRAAADSNLSRMAELWGTSRGSAKATGQPPHYERSVVVLQAYLRGDSVQILSDDPMPGDAQRRKVSMALWRSGCMKQIPVITVRSGSGWLVQSVDVSFAGNPMRPCEP
jgi:hypothetical protein